MPYETYFTTGLAILFFSLGLGVRDSLFKKLSLMYSVAFLLLSTGKLVEGQVVFADTLLNFSGYIMWVFIFYLNYRFVVIERAQEEEKYIDPLTGIKNRTYFEKVLQEKVDNYERLGLKYAVFFFDMDNLKQINDTFGHEAGDKAIGELAKAIKESLRSGDVVVRFGGDEFVVLALVKACSDALVIINRVEETLKSKTADLPYKVSFSAGFSCFPDEGKNFKELLKLADKRMYEVKHGKRMQDFSDIRGHAF